MGLGCVNSWGGWPLSQYHVKYMDYEFSFVLLLWIMPFRMNGQYNNDNQYYFKSIKAAEPMLLINIICKQ